MIGFTAEESLAKMAATKWNIKVKCSCFDRQKFAGSTNTETFSKHFYDPDFKCHYY